MTWNAISTITESLGNVRKCYKTEPILIVLEKKENVGQTNYYVTHCFGDMANTTPYN
jgi:hypothetical protein